MTKKLFNSIQIPFCCVKKKMAIKVACIIILTVLTGCSAVTTKKPIVGCGSCEPLKFNTKTEFYVVDSGRSVTLWSEPSGIIKYETSPNNSSGDIQTGTLNSVCIGQNEWIISGSGKIFKDNLVGIAFALIKKIDSGQYSYELPDREKFKQAIAKGTFPKLHYSDIIDQKELILDVTCSEFISLSKSCSNCFASKKYLETNVTHKERSMPSFVLPAATNKELISSDFFKNKVVLVTYFTSWAHGAIAMIPSLVKLQEELSEKSFTVLGLLVDEGEDLDKIAKLVKTKDINYPILVSDSAVRSHFNRIGSGGIPFSFLVDMDGNIIMIFRGFTPYEVLKESIVKHLQ